MSQLVLNIVKKKNPSWWFPRPNHQSPLSAQGDWRRNQSESADDIENQLDSFRSREPNLSIREDLAQANIFHETSAWDKVFIYRIPQCLREAAGDDKAYSPQIVSLGPYHHRKKRLRWMEQHKCRALNQILKRNLQEKPDAYMEVVRELEKSARDCYEGLICSCNDLATKGHTKRCSDVFVRMMLVDSCFILELFWGSMKGFTELGYSTHDPIFAMRATMHMIQRDMIMLENQIPLFILDKLFTLQMGSNLGEEGVLNLNQLAVRFFDPLTPTYEPSEEENDGSNLESPPPDIETPTHDPSKAENGKRNLEFPAPDIQKPTHDPSKAENGRRNSESPAPDIQTPRHDPSKAENGRRNSESPPGDIESDSTASPTQTQQHLLEVFRKNLLGSPIPRKEAKPVADKRRQHVIPCVTRLRQEEITFQSWKTDKFWDIKFEDGILKIPRLLIHNWTKSLFLNLIAYEQCHPETENEITSYLIFMDNLIDNPEDVTYLYTHGIIEHWLGSDAEVAELFNRMCQEVVFDRKGSYLYKVSLEVKDYRSHRWNGWRANLWHKYFNNPWSITSFIAAVVLLLLTAAQTFYTLYAYHDRPAG